MVDIVSITPNPAVDLSASGDKILPVAKLRGTSERHDPRGGGINIARVIKRLGGDPHAISSVGGLVGNLLRKLLDEKRVTSHTSTIAGEAREGFLVNEISTGPSRSWHRAVSFGRRQTSSDRVIIEAA